MNSDPFEDWLQRRPPPQLPAAWRAEILARAYAAQSDEAARRRTSPPRGLVFLPPLRWRALAAAWLLIAVLHLARPEAEPALASAALDRATWAEHWTLQYRLLAELLEQPAPPPQPALSTPAVSFPHQSRRAPHARAAAHV